MRELSLHILDLMENAIRAGATIVSVAVTESVAQDRLEIKIEDNGPGLPVSVEQALDPFFTTQGGKRTGLGLSLFRAAAEQAGGSFCVDKSSLGGVAVTATMQLGHIDRAPLGDLSSTVAAMLCAHLHLDLWCRICSDTAENTVRASDMVKQLDHGANDFVVAGRMSQQIRKGLAALDARHR